MEDYICPGQSCKICTTGIEETDGEKECMRKNVVYLITSKKGKHYVGITTGTLGHRTSQHHHAIKAGHGDSKKFIDYYNRPGNDFDEASVRIIDTGRNKEELLEKEREWIQYYDSVNNGLNSEL